MKRAISQQAQMRRDERNWKQRVLRGFVDLQEVESAMLDLTAETGNRKLARLTGRFARIRSKMANVVTAKLFLDEKARQLAQGGKGNAH